MEFFTSSAGISDMDRLKRSIDLEEELLHYLYRVNEGIWKGGEDADSEKPSRAAPLAIDVWKLQDIAEQTELLKTREQRCTRVKFTIP